MTKLIYPPTVFSYNWPEGDPRHGIEGREIAYDLYEETSRNNKPGDRLCHHAGAPGYGHVIWEITRIDDTGVYGFQVENTIRVDEAYW